MTVADFMAMSMNGECCQLPPMLERKGNDEENNSFEDMGEEKNAHNNRYVTVQCDKTIDPIKIVNEAKESKDLVGFSYSFYNESLTLEFSTYESLVDYSNNGIIRDMKTAFF